MGIFRNLKQYFSSDIYPDENKLTALVTPFKTSGGLIKINSKVGVPKNFAFVLGHSGKVLDCFLEGEYVLAPATLPECCKKLKIHKMDKQGKIKKKFKADSYFVSLKSFCTTFKTGQCIEMGNRAMGIFCAGAEGKANVYVSDPKLFVGGLLQEFAYLRLGEAEKIIQSWIGELIIKCFQKNNFALSELVDMNPIVEEKTKTDVSLGLSRCGLVMESLDFEKILLPKKYRKKAEENIKKQQKNKQVDQSSNLETKAQDVTQNLDENEKVENLEQSDAQTILQPEQSKNVEKFENDYVPFGDFEITENFQMPTENQSKESELDTIQVDENQSEQSQNQEYVDLNIDNIIKNNTHAKRCLACGAIVDEQARFCSTCGYKID